MNIETKNALSAVWSEVSGAESFATAAHREICAVQNAEKFTPSDAAFLRNRIEASIERAQKALELIPAGESE